MFNKPPVVEQVFVQQVTSPAAASIPPVQVTQEPFVPAQSIPKVPEPIKHGAPLNGNRPAQNYQAGPVEEVSVDSISDVQKIAIQSLYDMRGYKYVDLAEAILGNVPDINTLTHDQAVSIIQYGNDLYKKSKTN